MPALEPNADARSPLNRTNLLGPTAETLLASDGPVGADVADFLAFPQSKIHNRVGGVTGSSSDTESESVHGSVSEALGPTSRRMTGPHKPSPWWILIITAFSSILLRCLSLPLTIVDQILMLIHPQHDIGTQN
jgi:hypothetical protein